MSPEEIVELAKTVTNTYASDARDKEDIAQDVALAMWKANGRFKPSGLASKRTFLWFCGRMAVKDHFRQDHFSYKMYTVDGVRTGFRSEQTEWNDQTKPGSAEDKYSYNPELTAALQNESARDQQVLIEYLVMGEKAHIVAEHQGISENRVWQITSRFRKRCSHIESLKSLRQQPTDSAPSKPEKSCSWDKKRSRVIASTSFLNSVQRTQPMP